MARNSMGNVRFESRGVKSFSQQLNRLERPTSTMANYEPGQTLPGPGAMPTSPRAARERRMLVIGILSFGAVVSLMAAIAVNPTLLFVHLVFDVLLVAFCWLAFQRSARAAERAEKVHTLHVVPQAAPVIPEHLRRRAN